ncbi:inosine monophosphate dehydrogenase [Aaosphaeria arxii CBS 175.79]|uniref:Inosine monophosphate dehydrogenase n=1 Tax=Aaosphaeria arxii CBS 175.79 TaxID=1450172 RepID=A0A6A5XSU8_9PLEO|nr:inosine monophosphate dehydrogenase [Aaosphaeria arxii CBS 175.79]KAF2015887.1 inosine monophosphate dehydrogenase [Aaosphaeria arxii CBS 175.79]
MSSLQRLQSLYPWIKTPLVVGAPMRLIALADMAVELSKAGGIGFIGAGTDVSDLESHVQKAQLLLQALPTPLASRSKTLPIGLGFINWGASLPDSIDIIKKYSPAAVWFFAPTSTTSLLEWTRSTRAASPDTQVWVQVGSVKEALDTVKTVTPDVLVVQGTDAGGHGLVRGASLITLLPEVQDAVRAAIVEQGGGEPPIFIAAGGIVEKRGAAAAHVLGADGVVLGTRLLASHEANIARGYQQEIIRASDGGQSTVRTKVYDNLRRTTGWAETHNARGVINRSYHDAISGMDEERNKQLYDEETKKGDAGWGTHARMTTYAGSGVGLVKEVKSVEDIVREIREGVEEVLGR